MEHRDKWSENIKQEKKLLAMSYYIYARIRCLTACGKCSTERLVKTTDQSFILANVGAD